MREFMIAAISVFACLALATPGDADLIRFKSGGEIRCLTISNEAGMVICDSVSGSSIFPEEIVEEIVHDGDAGYAGTQSVPVVKAKTYPGGIQKELIEAVSRKDVNAVNKLLDEGADIDGAYQWEPVKIEVPPGAYQVPGIPVSALSGTPSGVTPLMMAARIGDATLVRLLLERGANPNVRKEVDDMGRSSALFEAVARGGNEENVRLILSRNPDYGSLETTFVHLATSEYLVNSYLDLFLAHGISEYCRELAISQAGKEGK